MQGNRKNGGGKRGPAKGHGRQGEGVRNPGRGTEETLGGARNGAREPAKGEPKIVHGTRVSNRRAGKTGVPVREPGGRDGVAARRGRGMEEQMRESCPGFGSFEEHPARFGAAGRNPCGDAKGVEHAPDRERGGLGNERKAPGRNRRGARGEDANGKQDRRVGPRTRGNGESRAIGQGDGCQGRSRTTDPGGRSQAQGVGSQAKASSPSSITTTGDGEETKRRAAAKNKEKPVQGNGPPRAVDALLVR
mmetsp:Transcript_6574/g.18873  ORF Transcript_6574/g.18873 Transcript_6574/m.18873 type:complete len:248 (+) Transcript_6574:2154-2897(+)